MSARQQQIETAQKAHQEGNFDAMCNAMIAVVKDNAALNPEERNMLYIAYKCATGKRRHDIKEKQDATAARELEQFCGELINILSQFLIPAAPDAESKVFYYKVMGDFYRYYDEVKPSQQNKLAAEQSYQTATETAAALPTTNPLRLNVALNFGVFYQETLGNAARGLDISRQALDNARGPLPALAEQQKAEASFVLSLLFDNVKLWSKDLGQQEPQPIQGLFVPPPPPQGQPGQQGPPQ
jgi:14-3-3 protein epsilon